MTLIICPQCSHENSALAEVCLECGLELVEDKMKFSEMAVILLVIATLIMIIYYMTMAPH